MYGSEGVPPTSDNDDDDVGASIEKELNALRKPDGKPMFTSVRLDTPCIIFFKVQAPPVDPVTFVHKICEDAAASTHRKQSRSVKRLTPMTLIGKATESGLEEVARQVLARHFHGPEPIPSKKVCPIASKHLFCSVIDEKEYVLRLILRLL